MYANNSNNMRLRKGLVAAAFFTSLASLLVIFVYEHIATLARNPIGPSKLWTRIYSGSYLSVRNDSKPVNISNRISSTLKPTEDKLSEKANETSSIIPSIFKSNLSQTEIKQTPVAAKINQIKNIESLEKTKYFSNGEKNTEITHNSTKKPVNPVQMKKNEKSNIPNRTQNLKIFSTNQTKKSKENSSTTSNFIWITEKKLKTELKRLSESTAKTKIYLTNNTKKVEGREKAVQAPVWHINRTKLERNPIILTWNNYHDEDMSTLWLESKPDCPGFNDCIFTSDRSLINQADAILIHIRNLERSEFVRRDLVIEDLPPGPRNPSQPYVFFLNESPAHTMHFPPDLQRYFNLTMTYRTDSDLYQPYGLVWELDKEPDRPRKRKWLQDNEIFMKDEARLERFLRGKHRLVAWFVTNCYTPSQRLMYVTELARFIDVDQFGNCNGESCGTPKECNQMLLQRYKFYLSFENTVCSDYITEKFFERVAYFTVPVVLSRKTHEKVLRNVPFIAADDFESPQKLADYLKYLDRNITAYKAFFRYRRKYHVEHNFPFFCGLCEKLKAGGGIVKPKYGPNVEQWWHETHDCKPNYGSELVAKSFQAQFDPLNYAIEKPNQAAGQQFQL